MNVINISKISIFGKIAWFSGNTPFYWNNTPKCSDDNWGGGGKGPVHYQAEGKNVLALASGFLTRQK